MTYLTCTLKSGLCLLIIPDTDAHMDGHPVLTWTYSLYRNENLFDHDDNSHEIHAHNVNDLLKEKDANLSLEKKLDESYLGYITIEIEEPEQKIFYTADSEEELPHLEVEEVIGQIINYRGNSRLWKY